MPEQPNFTFEQKPAEVISSVDNNTEALKAVDQKLRAERLGSISKMLRADPELKEAVMREFGLTESQFDLRPQNNLETKPATAQNNFDLPNFGENKSEVVHFQEYDGIKYGLGEEALNNLLETGVYMNVAQGEITDKEGHKVNLRELHPGAKEINLSYVKGGDFTLVTIVEEIDKGTVIENSMTGYHIKDGEFDLGSVFENLMQNYRHPGEQITLKPAFHDVEIKSKPTVINNIIESTVFNQETPQQIEADSNLTDLKQAA